MKNDPRFQSFEHKSNAKLKKLRDNSPYLLERMAAYAVLYRRRGKR